MNAGFYGLVKLMNLELLNLLNGNANVVRFFNGLIGVTVGVIAIGVG